MDETARRQLRPYVFVDTYSLHWMYKVAIPTEIDWWRLTITWKNCGQTPARNVRIWLSVDEFLEDDTPGKRDFPDLGKFTSQARGVGPTQVIQTRVRVDLDKLIRAWEENSTIFYWGWIEYDGIEGMGRHRTEICSILAPLGDPRSQDMKHTEAHYGPFNAADADCVHKVKT